MGESMKHKFKACTIAILVLSLLLSACISFSSDKTQATPNITNPPASTETSNQESSHQDAPIQEPSTTVGTVVSQPSSTSDTVTIPINSEFIVHFIDVGQGSAAFIECDGKTMLIDGGGASSSSRIYSFLERNGIDHLDYIVNTHPHEDHVGGLSGALNYVSSVGTVLGSATEYNNKAFGDFVKYLDEHNATITIPSPNETYMLGSSEVLILAPLKDYNNINNNSLVLKITYGETSFLFKGDAERQSELDMIDAGCDLSATVLKVSHHGSNSSTTYPFLREVMPEIAVISCGLNNQYGHPEEDVLSRLRDADVILYRTDLQGDIIIRSDGVNLTIETQKNADIITNPTEISGRDFAHIGNSRSKKFHTLDCTTLPEEHNRVHLETRNHAIDGGYDPCLRCNP